MIGAKAACLLYPPPAAALPCAAGQNEIFHYHQAHVCWTAALAMLDQPEALDASVNEEQVRSMTGGMETSPMPPSTRSRCVGGARCC